MCTVIQTARWRLKVEFNSEPPQNKSGWDVCICTYSGEQTSTKESDRSRTADFSRSHSRSNGFSSRMPQDSCSLGARVCASDLKQQFISAPFNPEAFIWDAWLALSALSTHQTADFLRAAAVCYSFAPSQRKEKSELLAGLHLDERTKKLFNTLTAFRTRTHSLSSAPALLSFPLFALSVSLNVLAHIWILIRHAAGEIFDKQKDIQELKDPTWCCAKAT